MEKKKYAVEVFKTLSKVLEIEANDEEEIEGKVFDLIADNKIKWSLRDCKEEDDVSFNVLGECDEMSMYCGEEEW